MVLDSLERIGWLFVDIRSQIGLRSSMFLFVSLFIFLLSISLERVYTIRLFSLLKNKYPSLHKRLVWISSLPNFSEWFKFIWMEKRGEDEISVLVYWIRLFELVVMLSALSLLIISILLSFPTT